MPLDSGARRHHKPSAPPFFFCYTLGSVVSMLFTHHLVIPDDMEGPGLTKWHSPTYHTLLCHPGPVHTLMTTHTPALHPVLLNLHQHPTLTSPACTRIVWPLFI
ncbi:hypothetical protein C8R42DRAFT_674746 [Lentinula raphanica]|nr:hypothetical protein C8R42DRAFT_674746 [Lentinula raphanica]